MRKFTLIQGGLSDKENSVEVIHEMNARLSHSGPEADLHYAVVSAGASQENIGNTEMAIFGLSIVTQYCRVEGCDLSISYIDDEGLFYLRAGKVMVNDAKTLAAGLFELVKKCSEIKKRAM